jgi:phosphonoacetaldehyde hydrolase
MGMNKKDHILKIVNDKYVGRQWYQRYKDYPDEFDMNILYNEFNENQYEKSKKMMDILPETRGCISYLNFNYIKTGCTTGFDRKNMEIIQDRLDDNGIYLDSYVSSTCLNKPSRPKPYMIHKNMHNLQINNPKEVMKIDDTTIGIEEGKNAGCITVGVARWSINMNIMNINDAYEFSLKDIQENLKDSRKVLKESGADYVIDTLDELPRIIETIKYQL